MKILRVQVEVIGWEEYTYEVPDDFEDYESLYDNSDWRDWEYLEDSGENTGRYRVLDEDYMNVLASNSDIYVM